jgi:phenylalanyl-tRNA synthetase beta chain
MQFPESWLREYCDPPIDTATLARVLTMAGMEVEDARPAAPPFRGVVVAEVLSVERHPNADRLNVCLVDTGRGETLSIVCGAPNVRAGIKVPCARIGAELPPADSARADGAPFIIRLGQIRGVESQGMLCSARELKLSDDHGGLLVLDPTAKVGEDLRTHLNLDDTLLTLKLTPNLAHCLSVYGVARELSALTAAPLRKSSWHEVEAACSARLPVAIEAPDLCGRFSGRVIREVDTKAATPAWMVDRLARCGQRSVNALVDISNYVMFETGQPTHIFDLDRISGGLNVRWGRAGESLKLLNGSTVTLDDTVGVIADATGVESLAGIMGGDATAVSDETRNVYVEAAFWWPEAVAGRSRRFNFTTDAGHRFERGVDPALTAAHVERITQLILQICGGAAGPVDDHVVNVPKREPVRLRVERAAKVIGMPLTQPQCEDVMRRLGFAFISAPGILTVTPPSWRFDLRIEEDLIEEVIRLIGYDALPDTPPEAKLAPRVLSESRRSLDAVRERMAALDYQETINFSFVDERWERDLAGNSTPIRLVNPMAAHMSVMRSSLLGSLIGVLQLNLTRKASRVRVFEAGRVFLRSPTVVDTDHSVAGVHQPMRLAGLVYGSADEVQWGTKERAVDFFDLKGDLEGLMAPRVARFVPDVHPAMHPGRCARVELDGQFIGHAGELHPKWRQAYELPAAPLLFELDAEPLLVRDLPVYAAVQRHQSVWRDLSVVVGTEVTHEALRQTIAAANPDDLVRSMRLFDVYRPTAPGADLRGDERSLSVRLELLDDSMTLTDERIEAAMAEVLTALTVRLGARLRS